MTVTDNFPIVQILWQTYKWAKVQWLWDLDRDWQKFFSFEGSKISPTPITWGPILANFQSFCRQNLAWANWLTSCSYVFVCVIVYILWCVCVCVCGKSSLTLWLEAWLAKGGMPLNGRELTDGQHWHHHTKRVSNPGVEYIFQDLQALLAGCVLLRVPDVLEFGLVCCPMIVQCRTNDLRPAG